ncbi:hypothetical protein CAEBREN_19841 [Caenorhabditis brenneri]|uniref:BTB domain-containing protein n=1 Tax=Caenorhabditis brenneri TaxID=135651 RepID=G0MIM7_CAEBE|nr:hypothetical protein CAEBREN_19841 [Caenorhabditis brenneri]
MSSESSRKRGGEKLDNEPADKVQAVSESTQDPDNVVLVVSEEKFNCSKKKLAEHSEHFKTMFFANFSEKNEKEVHLGDIHEYINVESALFAAGFLLSSTLENVCLEHLGQRSDYSSQEQLLLAEKTNSKNLLVRSAEKKKKTMYSNFQIQLCYPFRGVLCPNLSWKLLYSDRWSSTDTENRNLLLRAQKKDWNT